MANTQQLAQQILSYNSVGIIAGGEPSVDTLGSALALQLAIASLGKNAQVFSKNPVRAEHSRLVGCDKVEEKLGGQKNFVITLPNAVDVIEKVSCYAEGQKLNIVLQPYPDVKDFNPQDIQYAKVGGTFEAIVYIDVANRSDVQPIFGEQFQAIGQLPSMAIGKVGDNRSPISAIDPNMSATAQVVMQLLRDLRVQLTADMANNLLQAIYGATDDFHSPTITPRVFEDAAQLLKFVHKETGPQRSPIAPQTLPGQRDPFDYFAPPAPGGIGAPQAGAMPPLPGPGGRPPLPPLPPMPGLPPMPQPTGRGLPEIPAMDFGSDAWEIDQDFEFDRAPDQGYTGETMGGNLGRGSMPQPPRQQQQQHQQQQQRPPVRETSNLRTTPPMGQPQQQNRQQQQKHGNQGQPQQHGQKGQQQQHGQQQAKKDNKQQQPQKEDDWLSPKIYKTEDLM